LKKKSCTTGAIDFEIQRCKEINSSLYREKLTPLKSDNLLYVDNAVNLLHIHAPNKHRIHDQFMDIQLCSKTVIFNYWSKPAPVVIEMGVSKDSYTVTGNFMGCIAVS